MSYSQNGEDLIIAGCFPPDFKGTLLEIGAWEPKNLSNSRLLIENGWSAVLCEFSPEPVRQLIREYSHISVQVIAAAITAEEEHVAKFFITDDALSGNNPDHMLLWAKDGGFYGSLWVPTLSIRRLLDQFFGDRSIDFASIDTEGSSTELCIALLRTDHRPKVICWEHNGRAVEVMQEAEKHGYKMIHLNQENGVIAR